MLINHLSISLATLRANYYLNKILLFSFRLGLIQILDNSFLIIGQKQVPIALNLIFLLQININTHIIINILYNINQCIFQCVSLWRTSTDTILACLPITCNNLFVLGCLLPLKLKTSQIQILKLTQIYVSAGQFLPTPIYLPLNSKKKKMRIKLLVYLPVPLTSKML